MESALFWACGGTMLLGGILMVTSRNAVVAACWLIVSFPVSAGIFGLLAAPFLAILQILIYAGAIMVLFLFVIMLLNLGDDTREKTFDGDVLRSRGLALPVLVVGGTFVAGLVAIGSKASAIPAGTQPADGIGSPAALARALFVENALAFEGIGVLLLTTTIAVLVLAKRERRVSPRRPEAAAAEPAVPPRAPEPVEERAPVLAGGER